MRFFRASCSDVSRVRFALAGAETPAVIGRLPLCESLAVACNVHRRLDVDGNKVSDLPVEVLQLGLNRLKCITVDGVSFAAENKKIAELKLYPLGFRFTSGEVGFSELFL